MSLSFPYEQRVRTNPGAGAALSRGFTLIEMLVVLAIIIIVTAIALSGQSSFNRTLALTNAAYDIGLTIRQAQSYGLSSRQFSGAGGNAGYGLYFDNGTPTSYVLFADTYPGVPVNATPDQKPGDGIYTKSSELVETYKLNNGLSISQFCVSASGLGTVCKNSGLSALSITFTRPNTETHILGKSAGWSAYTSACVSLSSADGDTRSLSVTQTGQVATASSCP